MKQLEKKDLIIGQIYKHENGNLVKYQFDGDINGKIKGSYIEHNADYFSRDPTSNFTISSLILATQEVMKTFIPEYVEAISNRHSNSEIIGTIYKTSELPKWVEGHELEQYWKDYMFHYKPSTKKAYDAQFVVKEPEFVLPELWCIKLTSENQKTVIDYINKNTNDGERSGNIGMYYGYNGVHCTSIFNTLSNTEITFDLFKQYVLKEQLEEPKDKVLEKEGIDLNIGKIIRVESSEGAIYQLNDKITVFTKNSPNKGRKLTIKSFRWNNAKTAICAITELYGTNGIGLDKIELYSEPVVKELSLLEQAKLKYPIGTKFKPLNTNIVCEITTNLFEEKNNHIWEKDINSYNIHSNGVSHYIYDGYFNKWAEIIENNVKY